MMPYRPFLKGRCCSGTMGGRQVFRSNLQVTLYLNCLFTWEAISWWSKHHILSFKIPFVSLMNEFNDHKIKMMNAKQIRILGKYQLHTFSSTWRGCWINSKKCLNKDESNIFHSFSAFGESFFTWFKQKTITTRPWKLKFWVHNQS